MRGRRRKCGEDEEKMGGGGVWRNVLMRDPTHRRSGGDPILPGHMTPHQEGGIGSCLKSILIHLSTSSSEEELKVLRTGNTALLNPAADCSHLKHSEHPKKRGISFECCREAQKKPTMVSLVW